MWAKQKGFTIVELLIVIIVIAILAAITIIAYNGIQQRARNNARIAAATSIAKAINAYIIQTGNDLPVPLCVPTGGKDYTNDGVPDCNAVNNAGGRWSEKAAANASLTAAGYGLFSYPNDELTATDGTKYSGVSITYGASNRGMNGTLQPNFVYFWLEGTNQDCTSSLSVGNNTSNPDPLYWIVPARNYSYGNGLTVCAFTIRHSSSL